MRGVPKQRSAAGAEVDGRRTTAEYFDSLMASMSPLVTVDARLRVRFVNKPFLSEFRARKSRVSGRIIFDVLRLGARDQMAFRRNIGEARIRPVQNCEFRLRDQIYGYTMFTFEHETGIILKNITNIKRLERRVASLHSQLLRLQEIERQRLAGELHDGVGQTILAAKLNFVSFAKDRRRWRRLAAGLDLIDRASQELRDIYTNLYPATLRDLGLEAAVRGFAPGFLEVNRCELHMHFGVGKLPAEVEISLFRMIQEMLTNIVKHAGATRVSLAVESTDQAVTLSVADNGIGFSPEEAKLHGGGFGLENIRRRCLDLEGSLEIASGPTGTRIVVRVPPS